MGRGLTQLHENVVVCVYVLRSAVAEIEVHIVVGVDLLLVVLVDENHAVAIRHAVALQVVGLEILVRHEPVGEQ